MTEPATAPPRWLALTLAALTLVAVGGLGLLLFRDDLERVDDEEPATPGATAVVADDFDRDDGPLGEPWVESGGTWGVLDGHAVVTEAVGDGPALAVLEAGSGGGVARVTATAVEPGWAFAFRVVDPSTFVALVARPESGGWALAVVQGGAVEEAPIELPVDPVDGTRIEVTAAGGGVEISLNDTEPVRVEDVALADASAVGLAAFEAANLASMAWDDVEVVRS